MPDAPCPMPHARCPMPHAQCPMPNAQFPRQFRNFVVVDTGFPQFFLVMCDKKLILGKKHTLHLSVTFG
ncbi:hypothetical protein [Tolypothrix sp. VBCCA 56010]|uniref:hypothetical protein n=1 Tax=Tolypothrix sp. VBCCA 56010 TaxID=3137731 RepID=UPI003D7E7A15